MSLKAKLEAVIYAAEEPVTLGQLAALFAEDVLEWKAAQEAASTDMEDGLPEPSAALRLIDDEAEAPVEEPVAAEAEEAPAAEADAAGETEVGAGDEAAQAAADAAEAKKQARAREREARTVIRQLLDELIAAYASEERGVEIREIAGGYRMATKPEYHDAVRSFVKSLKPALKLSLPALETLAVIAYKQPVTAPEVNEIRGVDSSGVFGSLLARKLIATAGRKQVIGRPILYKTTREFLLRFGLKDVNELPSMEEFEKLAALELEEPEFEGQAENGEGRPAGTLALEVESSDDAIAQIEDSNPPAEMAATQAERDSEADMPAAPPTPGQAD